MLMVQNQPEQLKQRRTTKRFRRSYDRKYCMMKWKMKFNSEICKSVNRKNNCNYATLKIGTKLATTVQECYFI